MQSVLILYVRALSVSLSVYGQLYQPYMQVNSKANTFSTLSKDYDSDVRFIRSNSNKIVSMSKEETIYSYVLV